MNNILESNHTGTGTTIVGPMKFEGDATIVIPSVYNGTTTVLSGATVSLEVTYDNTNYSVYEDTNGGIATLTGVDKHMGLEFNGNTTGRININGGAASTDIPAVIISSDIGAFSDGYLEGDDHISGTQIADFANSISVGFGGIKPQTR